jgi:hypothetical protein
VWAEWAVKAGQRVPASACWLDQAAGENLYGQGTCFAAGAWLPQVLLLASYKGSSMEAVMQRRVCEKMDVWSLGVCLFELAAGEGTQPEARTWVGSCITPLPLLPLNQLPHQSQ